MSLERCLQRPEWLPPRYLQERLFVPVTLCIRGVSLRDAGIQCMLGEGSSIGASIHHCVSVTGKKEVPGLWEGHQMNQKVGSVPHMPSVLA